jgi:hypothetical protein
VRLQANYSEISDRKEEERRREGEGMCHRSSLDSNAAFSGDGRVRVRVPILELEKAMPEGAKTIISIER